MSFTLESAASTATRPHLLSSATRSVLTMYLAQHSVCQSQHLLLHRLHYAKVVKPEFALVWDFKITYEMAKN